MGMVEQSTDANRKTVTLKSKPTYTLTLSCGNLFNMSPDDRRIVLDLLEIIEKYEEKAVAGND
jgi:hypothetical protein